MKDYPFVKCLEPKVIHNPYTNERMIVPCRHCMACANMKADIQTLKCRLESKSHKWCMFITLTYSENNIPRMVLFPTKIDGVYKIKDDTLRFKKYKDLYHAVLHDGFPLDDDMINKLNHKFQNNRYAYLCKKDLQLFVKRLRKNLSKYSDEKIRYYAVGEIGPKHFRPHFHLLVWFDEWQTFTSLRKAIRESWKLGGIRAYIAKDAAHYVAGYVNSACTLPSIFKDNAFKPFCCHSSRLGETILKNEVPRVFETEYRNFAKQVHTLGRFDTEVSLWRSLKTWFFPKCRSYDSLSFGEYKYAYTLFATAKSWTGETSPFRQANAIVTYIYEYGFSHIVDEYQTLLNYFCSGQRFSTKKTCSIPRDYYEQMFNSIYHDLYISHHFLFNVCDKIPEREFPTQIEINKKIVFIYSFYKKENYENLKNSITNQINVLNSNLYDNEEYQYRIPYHYNNVYYDMDEFTSSPLPRMFLEDTYKRSEFNVKHKEQNDANKLLFNL